MKLLRRYVRALLTEAAKGLANLGDMVVYVDHTDGEIEIWIIDPAIVPPETDKRRRFQMNQAAIGLMSATQERGECLDGYVVTWAHVDDEHKGWGPMLYDVAMEFATLNGGGLMSDRGGVSPSARKVWAYYMNNRSDVTAHQLDDMQNTLTPEEEDNCDQSVAGYDITGPDDWYSWDPASQVAVDWVKSPLSKRYTAPPTMMDKLEAAGKLMES